MLEKRRNRRSAAAADQSASSGIGANVGGKWRREVPAPCLFSSLILQRFLFIQCLSATYKMQKVHEKILECLS